MLNTALPQKNSENTRNFVVSLASWADVLAGLVKCPKDACVEACIAGGFVDTRAEIEAKMSGEIVETVTRL